MHCPEGEWTEELIYLWWWLGCSGCWLFLKDRSLSPFVHWLKSSRPCCHLEASHWTKADHLWEQTVFWWVQHSRCLTEGRWGDRYTLSLYVWDIQPVLQSEDHYSEQKVKGVTATLWKPFSTRDHKECVVIKPSRHQLDSRLKATWMKWEKDQRRCFE